MSLAATQAEMPAAIQTGAAPSQLTEQPPFGASA
jgi:hypothetical protein